MFGGRADLHPMTGGGDLLPPPVTPPPLPGARYAPLASGRIDWRHSDVLLMGEGGLAGIRHDFQRPLPGNVHLGTGSFPRGEGLQQVHEFRLFSGGQGRHQRLDDVVRPPQLLGRGLRDMRRRFEGIPLCVRSGLGVLHGRDRRARRVVTVSVPKLERWRTRAADIAGDDPGAPFRPAPGQAGRAACGCAAVFPGPSSCDRVLNPGPRAGRRGTGE